MKLGFTGTSQGITTKQFDELVNIIKGFKPTSVSHGDCVGADATFHDICESLNIPIDIYPPENTEKRAWKKNATNMWPEKAYIKRDHDIVDSCDILIGCPRLMSEELRSGTWATIRYARKKDKEVIILWPKLPEKK